MAATRFDLEPELYLPTPRPIRIPFRDYALTAVAIALVIGAVFAARAFAGTDLANLKLLSQSGRVSTGKVIGRSTPASGSAPGYLLKYRFVADGKDYTGHESVGQEEYAQTRVGDPLQVTYLPTDPTNNVAGTVTDATLVGAFGPWLVLAGAAILVFVLILLVEQVTIGKEVRLLREGIAGQGQVTSMRKSGADGKAAYWITCNYWVGQSQMTREFNVPSTLYHRLSVGAGLTILYIATSPSKAIPYRVITAAKVKRAR